MDWDTSEFKDNMTIEIDVIGKPGDSFICHTRKRYKIRNPNVIQQMWLVFSMQTMNEWIIKEYNVPEYNPRRYSGTS